jgi:hypothetical protein
MLRRFWWIPALLALLAALGLTARARSRALERAKVAEHAADSLTGVVGEQRRAVRLAVAEAAESLKVARATRAQAETVHVAVGRRVDTTRVDTLPLAQQVRFWQTAYMDEKAAFARLQAAANGYEATIGQQQAALAGYARLDTTWQAVTDSLRSVIRLERSARPCLIHVGPVRVCPSPTVTLLVGAAAGTGIAILTR